MKPTMLAAIALLLNPVAILAQEQAPEKCPMCGMMKRPPKPPLNRDAAAQIAELDKLVTEMNGSLGGRKVEAMAAIVTRLVEHYKSMVESKPAPPPPPPKEEPHQH
jgi:hypothetical protein